MCRGQRHMREGDKKTRGNYSLIHGKQIKGASSLTHPWLEQDKNLSCGKPLLDRWTGIYNVTLATATRTRIGLIRLATA